MQNRLLDELLRRHAASDFGCKHDFAQVKNYEDFCRAVPLSNYAYLFPYIERCMGGETGALFGEGEEILMFALTSGTTERAKYIPVTKTSAAHYRRGWEIWGYKAISDHPASYLRKILQVSGRGEEKRTAGGIACGSISAILARNQGYVVRRFYATPRLVSEVEDAPSRYYTIMRLAIPEDVAWVSTANPSTLLALAQTAEAHAEALIRDVHDGTLTGPGSSVGASLREGLRTYLRANPTCAKKLEQVMAEQGRLLPQHVWDLSFLANWTGGTLGLYLPRLAEYYGTVPIRDIGLLASEGRMTIPMEDNSAAGILDISSCFYEFVPQEEIDAVGDVETRATLPDDLTTLQACQLEKGKCYYIFLTNFAGLYRYNIGDLVRVVEHEGTTPVLEFLSKGAHSSSVTGEKLTEKQVVDAVRLTADALAISLESFVAAPVWEGRLPHYRLLMAAKHPLPRQDMTRLGQGIDQRLAMVNMEYEGKRESGRLGAFEARQVAAQVLAEYDEKLMKENAGRREQFKHRFLYRQALEWD